MLIFNHCNFTSKICRPKSPNAPMAANHQFWYFQILIDNTGVEVITPSGKVLLSLNGKESFGEIEGEDLILKNNLLECIEDEINM